MSGTSVNLCVVTECLDGRRLRGGRVGPMRLQPAMRGAVSAARVDAIDEDILRIERTKEARNDRARSH
jgi:hypothetical protein